MSARQKPAELRPHFRTLEFDRAALDAEKRTVALSFSSEDPYQRWWGIEILGHDKGEVELARLTNGAPLLLDHNTRDQIGVIEGASIGTDRKGRAVVRFGKSARAEEIFNDVKDGIRSKVSVGYRIHEMVLVKEEDDVPTYRVTRWEPLEISIVAVPADDTVGIGRSGEDTRAAANPVNIRAKEPATMQTQTTAPAQTPAPPVVDVAKERADARKAELERIREIGAIQKELAFAGVTPEMAQKAINAEVTVEEFRKEALKEIAKRGVRPVDLATDTQIGLSEKEAREFSFVRAIKAAADGDWSKAGFEQEVNLAVQKKFGKEPRGGVRGFLVPDEVLRQQAQRDQTVGTATAGGHLKATNLLAGSFIDLLRNRMMLSRLGITMLSGLVGDIAIPRQTGGATAYWVAEGNSPTESQLAVDQVALAPKTVGAFTDMSRKLLLQSTPDIEGLVRRDLATVIALEVDRVGINGSGTSPEPRGILNQAGIGAVVGGTNGAAPTWANIVGLETEVATDNADVGAIAYLTNAKVRGKLKTTEKAASTGMFIWGDNAAEPGMGMLNGYRAAVSNQVPSNLTKGTSVGVCSAIIFGNFADLLVGLWSGLDVLVDPYTGGTAGTLRIIVHQDLDLAVRHAESFSAMADALTT